MIAFLATAGVVLLAVAIIVACLSVGAWILMILLGTLASLTGWSVAIGFLPCLVIVAIISLFFPSK